MVTTNEGEFAMSCVALLFTEEESCCGCTVVEVYTAVTMLSTLMSQ